MFSSCPSSHCDASFCSSRLQVSLGIGGGVGSPCGCCSWIVGCCVEVDCSPSARSRFLKSPRPRLDTFFSSLGLVGVDGRGKRSSPCDSNRISRPPPLRGVVLPFVRGITEGRAGSGVPGTGVLRASFSVRTSLSSSERAWQLTTKKYSTSLWMEIALSIFSSTETFLLRLDGFAALIGGGGREAGDGGVVSGEVCGFVPS